MQVEFPTSFRGEIPLASAEIILLQRFPKWNNCAWSVRIYSIDRAVNLVAIPEA